MTKTATQRETLSPDSLHNWAQTLVGRESYLLIGAGFSPINPISDLDVQSYRRTQFAPPGTLVMYFSFPSASNGEVVGRFYLYDNRFGSLLQRNRYLLTYDDVMLAVRGMSNYNLFLRLEEKASE